MRVMLRAPRARSLPERERAAAMRSWQGLYIGSLYIYGAPDPRR